MRGRMGPENPNPDEVIKRLTAAVAFYKRRCDALQDVQSSMRDPERTIVCDILANGCTLQTSGARGRYDLPS